LDGPTDISRDKYNRGGDVGVNDVKVNIKLTVDADLLHEIQALAAKDGTSVGALVTASLKQIVCERRTYESARKRALDRLRQGFDLQWKPARSRNQLHER
jgi:hypothetical protein